MNLVTIAQRWNSLRFSRRIRSVRHFLSVRCFNSRSVYWLINFTLVAISLCGYSFSDEEGNARRVNKEERSSSKLPTQSACTQNAIPPSAPRTTKTQNTTSATWVNISPRVVDDPILTAESFNKNIKPFFQKHCVICHNAEKQKGDRQFDGLVFPIPNDDMLIDFQDALDALNLGEMPPAKRPQPGDEEKAKLIEWLTAAIKEHQTTRQSTGGETVLRRINRREYLFVMEDLFDLDTRGFDPTDGFPADQTVHHLDNQGDALVTSGFLLAQYLASADEIVDKSIPTAEKPNVKHWTFRDNFTQQPELDSRLKRVEQNQRKTHASSKTEDNPIRIDLTKQIPSRIRLYEHPRSRRHMGCFGFVKQFVQGVPVDGFYEIELDVESLYRELQYDKNYAQTNPDEPMFLAIVPGDITFSDLHVPQPLEPELARFELKDGRQTVKAKLWLHAGTTPRFTWVNGSSKMRSAFIAAGKDLLAEQAEKKEPSTEDAFRYGLEHAKLPQVHIHQVDINGPVFEQWPQPAHKELIGGSEFDSGRNRENLERFLKRAYRRPIAKEEVDRIMKVIAKRQSQGISPLSAYRDGIKTALCSPSFLYLDEPANESGEQLEQYAIASRLSFYLWSSIPDEPLMCLAAAGKLSDPKILGAQVDRMLADPKSDRFVDGFLKSWLTLDALGQTPPDRGAFEVYYSDNLEHAMETETRLFTRHILDERLSIDEFLESDFTFVNPELARLYDLKTELDGFGFQKIKLDDRRRGGLLGQASVLTVTANGVDTSPIVRGVWLLDNLLGTPPNPPPPDVEPLDPDIRGAVSIRDQMEKHRNNATCAECHRKIDPLGFALENFDAIGRWRSSYKGSKGKQRVKIDASGTMVDGTAFKNVVDFKSALANQRDKFARGLTEKLMSYALGRGVEISDRPEVDAILKDLEANDRRFRFLVKRIVTSPTFIKP